jgi:DNA repair protein RadC
MDQPRNHYTIHDLDLSERPRERLAIYGPSVLSNAELIAIILRVGVEGENAIRMAERLLQTFEGIIGLHKADLHDLQAQHGMGPAKAAQLKAALEIGERLRKATFDDKPAIHSPGDAADILLHSMSALEQEELRVLLLDTRNRILGTETVYRGSLNSSQVRVGEMFKAAIRRNAASVIIAHNHPSGDPTPSPEDIAVTRAFVQAGKLLDIEVLDHLIIAMNRWISLKERGLGFG